MGFWGKKEESLEETTKVVFEGKEVNVNPTPAQRIARNRGRMGRIQQVLRSMEKKGRQDTPRYEKFRRELAWRKVNQDMIDLRGGN